MNDKKTAETSEISSSVNLEPVIAQSDEQKCALLARLNEVLARCASEQCLTVGRQRPAAADNAAGRIPSTRAPIRKPAPAEKAAVAEAPRPTNAPATSTSNRDALLNQRLLDLLQTIKRRMTPRIGTHQDFSLMSQPTNSVLSLMKMVLVPIILVAIAVLLVPHLQDIAKQTFNAIFYNCKLPESRAFDLKRVTVGIMLLFENVVKKLFPVVRLRWSNNKMFRRRNELVGQRAPNTARTVPIATGRPPARPF